MTRLVLKNIGHLVTMNPQRELLRDAFIVVEDGLIRQVGTGPLPLVEGAEAIDAKGGICLPGLINTHHHMFQNLARAFTPISNPSLLPWLAGHMPLWENFSPDDLFVATQVAAAELMLSGCTLTSDHHYLFPAAGSPDIMDAGFHAAESMGLRYVGCRGSVTNPSDIMPAWSCQKTDAILEDCQRLFDKFHDAKPGSMRQVAFAPCTVFGCEGTLHKETAHLTRNRMGVAHCPCSNMRLGSGVCRVNDLRAGGSPVSLGVDGSASNDSGHMLNEARLALFLTRVVHGAESMTVEKVLEMATLDGARNLGRTADLGSVEPGKCADLAVFPAEDIWSNGAENKVHALLLCHPRNVETLVVHGKVRVSEGRLVGVDLPRLLEHHRKTAARTHARG